MPDKSSRKAGHSRSQAEARLRSATQRAKTRWTPPPSGGMRSNLKYVISRTLRPYDRHSSEVLRGVVNDVQAATLAVADDVDDLRAERALFDTFVTPDMDKPGLELHAKRSRFCSYLGDHLAVCRVLGNMKMFVDTRDHVLAPHLMTDGYWESWITLAMLRALKPGMVAVDVGANYGYSTILMGRCVGRTGKVISFEPNPHLASLMRKSLWISGIRLIDEVREEAAYSTTGEKVRFFIPEGRPMNARVVDEAPYAGTLIDVPTVRLDDVLPEKVDFIKIDAEGASGRSGGACRRPSRTTRNCRSSWSSTPDGRRTTTRTSSSRPSAMMGSSWAW
jgi:FkbM family methyltransferase